MLLEEVRPVLRSPQQGVALILDIDLKLLEQPSVEDESVNSIAGSQTVTEC